MALEIEWLVGGRVCLVIAPHIIDAEALQNHDIAMLHWLDKTEERVYVIVDVSAMKQVTSLKQAFSLKHIRHPRMTHIFTVGLSLNPMARFVIPMAAYVSGVHYKDFATREDALKHITDV